MSRTLVLMLGMGLWLTGSSRAADKPEKLDMPKTAASAVLPKAEPAMAEPAKAESASAPDEPSGCCKRRCARLRGCLGHFKDWLCYHDCQQPCKPKLCGSVPCCHPQLHTFFLHRCEACTHEEEGGIPITFNYTDLLERNGDSHCGSGGCGSCGGGCRGCK
jgi:hypothetical protein